MNFPVKKFVMRIALVIVLCIGLYMLAWLYQYNKFQDAKTEASAYKNIATQLEQEFPEVEVGPSILVWQLRFDRLRLEEINRAFEQELEPVASTLQAKLELSNKDRIQLAKQTEWLGIEAPDFQPNSSAEVAPQLMVGEKIERALTLKMELTLTEKFVVLLKGKIQDYTRERRKVGEFVNPLWDRTDRELETMILGMSSKEKAGQLLIFAVEGHEMTDEYRQRILELSPGGMIYMGYNVVSPDQLQKLSKDLQGTNVRIPLILAVDQEGGVVKRISWDPTSGQTKWARMTDNEVCEQAKTRAEILRKAGINVNFAPVVDLTYSGQGFINNRTISSDPNVVTEKSKKFVECSQAIGVFTTLKHYPGHGSTGEDSHKTLPRISKSKQDWLATDAVPFREIEGSKLIMVGHLKFDNLDPEHPSSQSYKLITEILRGEFGYDGVVVTDAMGQLHGSTGVSVHDALKLAYNSGVDIVLYVSTPATPEQIKEELVAMIDSGEIDEAKVNAALLKIFELKREIK